MVTDASAVMRAFIALDAESYVAVIIGKDVDSRGERLRHYCDGPRQSRTFLSAPAEASREIFSLPAERSNDVVKADLGLSSQSKTRWNNCFAPTALVSCISASTDCKHDCKKQTHTDCQTDPIQGIIASHIVQTQFA